MIKVSVLYPSVEGTTFDYDYYVRKHIPMVAELLSGKLISLSVDRGIAGADPGAAPPFVAMAHLVFNSVDDFQAAYAPHAEQIGGDAANYTDTKATVQISEVVSGRRIDHSTEFPMGARG
jgi:uncharacterized protein (TIGR02118 family)